MIAWRKPTTRGGWAVLALAALLFLIGAVMIVGGVWLMLLRGSWFYALAGVGLIASGWHLAHRRMLGAWIYGATFLVTLLWAFWEVGLSGWALVPRVLGPTILLLFVILALPYLDGARRRWRMIGLGGYAAFVFVLCIAIAGANRADEPGAMPGALTAAMADPALLQAGADWPAYGGTYSAQRYSPLDQIDRDNVGELERVWEFRTGELPEERWGAETTPLKIGDTLYLCTGMSQAIALDAASGQERWRFDPQVAEENIPYTAACRGVAYHEQPQANGMCAARIIYGTLDARLIALDARTGERCAGFGDNGEIDITEGMGRVEPGMVSITSAPTIVRGVVVTGHQVLDGQTVNAPSGVVQGYDVITGARRWAWDMADPEGDSAFFTRGTPNMWTTASGDEELGHVYLPLGNSAADSKRAPHGAGE